MFSPWLNLHTLIFNFTNVRLDNPSTTTTRPVSPFCTQETVKAHSGERTALWRKSNQNVCFGQLLGYRMIRAHLLNMARAFTRILPETVRFALLKFSLNFEKCADQSIWSWEEWSHCVQPRRWLRTWAYLVCTIISQHDCHWPLTKQSLPVASQVCSFPLP